MIHFLKKNWVKLSLIFLFIASFILRYISLSQTDFANGWDGYYYLIQIKAYLEEGAMHSADISLVYPYFIFLAKLFGNYIESYKIGSALLSSFFIVSIYFLAKSLIGHFSLKGDGSKIEQQNKYRLIPLVISLFAVFSPSMTFFTSQFPKNLMGLIFFNLFFISVIKKKDIFYKKQNFNFHFFWQFKYIALTFLLSFVTHRFAAGLAIITLAFTFAFYLIITKKYKLIFIGLVLAAFTLILSIIFPGTLHFYDLERFSGLFSSTLQIAPLSFVSLMGLKNISLFWLFEMFFLYGLIFTSMFFYIKKFPKKFDLPEFNIKSIYTLILILSFTMVFPFFYFDLMGIAYRFFFGFLFLTPILLIPILKKLKQKALITIMLIFSISSLFSYQSYKPIIFDPPYKQYQRIATHTIDSLGSIKYDLLVAHKALAEIITFETGVDVLPWQPEKNYSHDRVWRIVWGVPYEAFSYFKVTDYLFPINSKYSLIREDRWQAFLKAVKKSKNKALLKRLNSWRNPSEQRPEFILKGRKSN